MNQPTHTPSKLQPNQTQLAPITGVILQAGKPPMIEVILNNQNAVIIIDPSELSKLNPDDINPSTDFALVTGSNVGGKTKSLTATIAQTADDTSAKRIAYKVSEPKDRPIPGGSTEQSSKMTTADAQKIFNGMTSSPENKINELKQGKKPNKLVGLGKVFIAGSNPDNKLSISEDGAEMGSGDTTVATGGMGVQMGGASMKMACQSDQVQNAMSKPNPLMRTLGPSTTMNPFPQYLIAAGGMLLGIYAITKAIQSFGGSE